MNTYELQTNILFGPWATPPPSLLTRKTDVDAPRIVRDSRDHDKLANPLVDYLCELIQTAEIG